MHSMAKEEIRIFKRTTNIQTHRTAFVHVLRRVQYQMNIHMHGVRTKSTHRYLLVHSLSASTRLQLLLSLAHKNTAILVSCFIANEVIKPLSFYRSIILYLMECLRPTLFGWSDNENNSSNGSNINPTV